MAKTPNPLASVAGLTDKAATGADGLPLKPEGATGTNQDIIDGKAGEPELPLDTTDANITAGITDTKGPEEQRLADGVLPTQFVTLPQPAAVNADGYRNKVMNPSGYVTTLDDETAKVFFENPKFYAYVYDEAERKSVMVHTMRWVDVDGFPLGEQVLGERYSKD